MSVSKTISEIRKLLPPRTPDMHKGDRGRLLIAGGSRHYPGAPALSALGALRSGAGVVTLLSGQSVCDLCAARLPEVVYHPEDENDKNKWTDYVLKEESKRSFRALVIGPGLERSCEAQDFTAKAWQEWQEKILVDGDGLFALAEKRDELATRSNALITPHEGEAARLLGISATEVKLNREHAARELANRWSCVVLKGHGTLIASAGCEEIFCINWGGPELSVPGSGDVLSGCIGAFLAMGLEVLDAAILGASVHGMAGDFLSKDGVDGVMASEIAETIRKIIHQLREGKTE